MLEQIICYLVTLATQSNYFEKIIPFARLVTAGDGKVSPKEYIANGQLKDVSIFDNVNGLAYFRMTGKQRIGFSNKNEVPCYDEFLIDFPIRLVGAVLKKKLSKDDAFSETRMTQSLIAQLSIRHSELTKDLKASSVTFLPNNVTVEGNIIATEEYKGQNIRDINYNYAYIAIDFTASVRIKINCIEQEC